MRDCPRCGKKMKTLYERHGAKALYEAMGFYCNRCGILYDKDLKKSASASNMLAAGASKAVNGREQARERLGEEPLSVVAKPRMADADGSLMREWGRPDSNQRPPAPEAGILPS
jgi:hypothetical protein